MSLLSTIYCKSCGAPLQAPVTLPKVRVQCSKCHKFNVLHKGRWSAQEMPVEEVKPLPTPKAPAPVVVGSVEPVETVLPPEVVGSVEPVETVLPPEVVEPETLTWSPDMLKADLVEIATKLGIDTSGMLKREVVDALENLQ